jgi:hypothetical protein
MVIGYLIRYLKLAHCSLEKLKTISALAPQLKSFDIHLDSRLIDIDSIILPFRLTRLNLKVNSK